MKNKNKLIPLSKIHFENIEIENNCFDCGCRNPELISINNGILICSSCGINHMTFPPGASILVSNEKNSLTEKELQYLKLGGNKKLYEFILSQCPSLINLPKKLFYISPLIEYYRKRLENLVDAMDCIDDKLSKKKMKHFLNIPPVNPIESNNSFSPNSKSYANERYNTINYRNNTCDENELKNIMSKIKNIKNKCEDDFNNYLLTQRTATDTFNNIKEKKDKKDKKETIFKKLNIVYYKPKLQNVFSKIKAENKESNEKVQSFRNNISQRLIDINNNNYYSNTDIEIDDLRKRTPSKGLDTPFKINNYSKYSSKTIIREREKMIFDNKINVNKDRIFRKINPLFSIKNMKNINLKKKYKNYTNYKCSKTISKDSKNIKGEKKIKEIIINKNLNCTNIIYNNNSNICSQNTKRFIEQRRPIQVNLSLQNTIDNSQNNNNYKINNYCFTDSNINETPTIIIHNTCKNLTKNIINDSKEERNEQIYTRINIKKNKNFKHNTEKQDSYTNKELVRTKSENKIKTININFMKNMKNKILNNKQKTKDKYNNMPKDNKSKEKDLIKKDNVAQFQILPIKIFKKINPKKIDNNRTNINPKKKYYYNKSDNSISYKFKKGKNCEKENENNAFEEKRKLTSPYRNENKSEKIIDNNILSCSYKKVPLYKIGETFKNSIRNKYKREKSKKNI